MMYYYILQHKQTLKTLCYMKENRTESCKAHASIYMHSRITHQYKVVAESWGKCWGQGALISTGFLFRVMKMLK